MIIVAVILVLGFVNPGLSQVMINEILFDPASANPAPTNHQWVEIYNKGAEPVNLNGWTITNSEGRDGPAAFRLPPLTISASGYLVVHFAAGEDRFEFGPDGAHIYARDSAGLWNPAQDGAALYSPSGIVDFLAWRPLLTPLREGRRHWSWRRALWFLLLGEKEEALGSLELARQHRLQPFVHVAADPGFDALREEPRFRRLVSDMGLDLN